MSAATTSRVATAYARTREHLGYLGLTTASERLAAELERATSEAAAPVEVLERILAAEVEATAARRLAARLRFAHYPLAKRLETFEFDFQPLIDRSVIGELSTLRFVDERRNVLLLGPPGVGKSHLSIALGIAATEAGYRTYFTTAADLVSALQSANLEGSWSAKMRTYTGPSVLVIDELGCAPRGAISPGGQRGPPPATAMAGRCWGQPDAEGAAEGGSSPDNVGTVRPGGSGPQARQTGAGKPNQCLTPLDSSPAPNPVAMGGRGAWSSITDGGRLACP